MTDRKRIVEGTGRREGRVWRVAAYIRLSREDSRSFDESESVANQRAIIREHIADLDDGDRYVMVREYVDDGISGVTDDERRGFQEMLADIRRGLVNCVIVKDLARSFRNYSDQGYYLDDWFPRHGVRFISLFHQPLDSYREPGGMRSIAVPIQGVLNENHCAETSDKVREVFDMKRRSGEHIGSFAVYGYKKDPGNRNALLIDPEAADVVREIFRMFLDGMSKNAIVRCLNDYGVPCPSRYKRERLGLSYQNPSLDPAREPLWCAATVAGILKNCMYCGDMVQGRYRVKSYKVHVQERVPEEEWYVVENTHEPVVDRETFGKVRRLLLRDTRTSPKGKEVYLFGGFLRCADCKRAMSRSKARGSVYYYCRTYKDQSKSACSSHMVRHGQLEAAVLCAIRLQVYAAVDADRAVEQAGGWPGPEGRQKRLSDAIERKEGELARISRYAQAIYQDWKDGEITRDDYRRMKEDYGRQGKALSEAVEKLRARRQYSLEGTGCEDPVLSGCRNRRNIEGLTRSVLIELVDYIEVQEGGWIRIAFRFAAG